MVPELLMGNRVLRTFDKDGNSSLRIQFRDDDGSQLRRNTTGPCLIQSTTYNTLAQGIHVGSWFLMQLSSRIFGFSSSQVFMILLSFSFA